MTAWVVPIGHHVSCCSLPRCHSSPPPSSPPLGARKREQNERKGKNRQNRTEQNRTKQSRTEQNRTEPCEKAGIIPGLSRSPVYECCCHHWDSQSIRHTHALAGAQHTSKAKSWKLHSADPPGMPNPTPLHPPSPSLGQGCLRAKSGNAPSAVLKTGTPSGFDKSAGWTSDHPDPGSLQASTARRRSESSQAKLSKGVDLHAVQEPAAPPVGSSRLHTKVSCPCPPL